MTDSFDPLLRTVTVALTPTAPTSVQRRLGTVTVLAGGPPPTVTVTVGATSIPGVRYLASYAPVAGDVVLVDFNGPDPIVLGVIAPGGALSLGSGVAYVPTLKAVSVNPTLGSGAIAVGRYIRLGRWCAGWLKIQFGSGGGAAAGSGAYAVGLPLDALETSDDQQMGQGIIAFGANAYVASLTKIGSDGAKDCRILFTSAAAPTVTHNNPYAWGAAALLSFNFGYETVS